MMNRKWLVVLGVLLLAAQAGAEEPPVLNTMKDKLSYAIGIDMVRSFQRQGIEVDRELFLKGVKDGLSGGTLLISDEDINRMLKMFRAEQKMKLAERKRQQSERLRNQRRNATTVEPGTAVPTAPDKQRP